MFKFDSEDLNNLVKHEIKEFIKEHEFSLLLIDMKELCRLLSLSRPTVDKVFMSDPNFPAIRVGKKFMFNRKSVEKYIEGWSLKNRGKFVEIGVEEE
jgi:excisionase family DNA binding protein